MMRIDSLCFVAAGTAALTGMGLGMFMGLTHDFTLAPAHAHLNLLGWVTMCLYGLYHRGREKPATILPWIQVVAGIAGFVGLSGGLATLLTIGGGSGFRFLFGGMLFAITSMLLFLVIVIGDATICRRRKGQQPVDVSENRYQTTSGAFSTPAVPKTAR